MYTNAFLVTMTCCHPKNFVHACFYCTEYTGSLLTLPFSHPQKFCCSFLEFQSLHISPILASTYLRVSSKPNGSKSINDCHGEVLMESASCAELPLRLVPFPTFSGLLTATGKTLKAGNSTDCAKTLVHRPKRKRWCYMVPNRLLCLACWLTNSTKLLVLWHHSSHCASHPTQHMG